METEREVRAISTRMEAGCRGARARAASRRVLPAREPRAQRGPTRTCKRG